MAKQEIGRLIALGAYLTGLVDFLSMLVGACCCLAIPERGMSASDVMAHGQSDVLLLSLRQPTKLTSGFSHGSEPLSKAKNTNPVAVWAFGAPIPDA